MRPLSAFVLGLASLLTTACGGKSSQDATLQPTGYTVIEPISMENADVAIDATAVYWLDWEKSAVFRRGFAKDDVAVRLASDIMPQALTMDAENVYWAAYVDQTLGSIRLMSSSKDGQQISTLVAGGLDSYIWPGKPIAAGGGYVYWQKTSEPRSVQRVASTGGSIEEFVGPSGGATITDPEMKYASSTQPLFAEGKVFAFLNSAIQVYDVSTLTITTALSSAMNVLDSCFTNDTLVVVGQPNNDQQQTGVWAIRAGTAQLVSLGDTSTRVACGTSVAYFAKLDLGGGAAPVGPLQIYEIDSASLQPRLLLKLADTERSFSSHLAYGGNALAFFSSSGLIRVPLDAGN
jgi:hypothetical protein